MSDQIDMDYLNGWIGKKNTETAFIATEPFEGLSATLRHDKIQGKIGAPLPPMAMALFLTAYTCKKHGT